MTMTATSGDSTTLSDTVDLRVPADPAYLAVLRTATAGLAARLDLTLDEIEDLRIAVDEVMLHRIASGGSSRGNLDFAIDRGQVVVNGTRADD